MTDEVVLKNQVEFLYNATAKMLYNLTLYTVQNQPLAEQLTVDAFVAAFNSLSDKSNIDQFRIKSTKLLYRSIKKSINKANRGFSKLTDQKIYEDTELLKSESKNRLNALLFRLEYDERFILLLFLQQKFSQKQIAQILCVPRFISRKRLCQVLNKAMNLWG